MDKAVIGSGDDAIGRLPCAATYVAVTCNAAAVLLLDG